jgi:uncharacterized membrane protein (UPF0182 family)
MKVNAIDEDGRASLGAFKSMDVVKPGDPGGGDTDNTPDYPFIYNTMAIALVIIGIIGAVLIFLFVPLPEIWKIIVSVVWVLVFIALAIMSGTGAL